MTPEEIRYNLIEIKIYEKSLRNAEPHSDNESKMLIKLGVLYKSFNKSAATYGKGFISFQIKAKDSY